MEFSFENLPGAATTRIFQHFTFEEIAELRPINKWFNSKCAQILNKAFLDVKPDLDIEICALNDLDKNGVDNQLKYKILQMMRSEISTLYVVCERYVKANVHTFSGGKILDSFYKIMSKNFDLSRAKNPFESENAMMLFLMCEEYADYFEDVLEPKILGNSFCLWYGSKIVDLLDLNLYCNYHMTANYRGESCHISARYEILKPECLSELKLNQFDSPKENLRFVAKYVRNQMRWHNFFFYVDSSYETIHLNKRKDKKYNKFCLNLNEMFDEHESDANKSTRTFSRRLGNPCFKENASFAVELHCGNDFLPRRLQQYIPKKSSEPPRIIQNRLGLQATESARIYEFLLTLKLVQLSNEKTSANENLLELYHSFYNCEVTQKSKEIPV